MSKGRILVIDDDNDILEFIRYNLAREGYRVTCVTNGEQALVRAMTEEYDLLLLDLLLPGKDGLSVLRELKQTKKKSPPVIIISAKGEDSEIATGLQAGADDYITKPFNIRIMLVKIKKILRGRNHANDQSADMITVRDIGINPSTYQVFIEGTEIPVSITEFKILHFLATRPGRILSRRQIISHVHGSDHAITDRSVDVHIASLRKKLGAAGEYIETVRSEGYRFKE